MGATCRSKLAKLVPIECKNGRHLENLSSTSSPEQKGQSTQNLAGSIRETFKQKIAESFRLETVMAQRLPS